MYIERDMFVGGATAVAVGSLACILVEKGIVSTDAVSNPAITITGIAASVIGATVMLSSFKGR